MDCRGILIGCGLSALLATAPALSAEAWTCRYADLTREIVVFYPEAPAPVPCRVFYAKPTENALPRVVWEARNEAGYCERKAAAFVERLEALGWHCSADAPGSADANARDPAAGGR